MGIGVCFHAHTAANGSRLRRTEAVPIRNIARMPAACVLTASAKAAGEKAAKACESVGPRSRSGTAQGLEPVRPPLHSCHPPAPAPRSTAIPARHRRGDLMHRQGAGDLRRSRARVTSESARRNRRRSDPIVIRAVDSPARRVVPAGSASGRRLIGAIIRSPRRRGRAALVAR